MEEYVAIKGRPDVPTFYGTKKILITGASGYMGRVLLEKLIRDCPGIGCIYILVRQKKGREPRARLDTMFQSPMFARLQSERPGFEQRIRAMRGEMGQEGLGLSPEDTAELLAETDIIFHCAANVRFDLSLKEAIINNTLGTYRVLEFAKNMTKLQCFTHVSTSYCHCDLDVLEEKMYPSADNPHKVIDLVQWMSDPILEIITPKLIRQLPNTYSYSKNLTEQLVGEYNPFFPIVVVRPSIVTSAWKEPLPGWVDNLNGPIGLLVAAGKGVLRSMHCKPDYPAEIMPVDIAINAIILVTYHRCTSESASKEPLVCNVTTTSEKMPSWGDMVDWGRSLIYINPFNATIWYPNGSIKNYRIFHELSVFFYQLVPAYLIDLLLFFLGRKRFMVRLHHRIQNGLGLLQYYTTKKWNFRGDCLPAIRENLTRKDNESFYTDMSSINWYEFLGQALLGTRHYCLHEDPKTLPQARKRMRVLYYIDLVVSYVFYIALVWALFIWSEPLATAAEMALSAVFRTLLALPGVRMIGSAEEPGEEILSRR